MEQFEKIKGYRKLTEQEISLMNECKELGQNVGNFVEKLKSIESLDQKWVSIGMVSLQKGFMLLSRAIAKPDTF